VLTPSTHTKDLTCVALCVVHPCSCTRVLRAHPPVSATQSGSMLELILKKRGALLSLPNGRGAFFGPQARKKTGGRGVLGATTCAYSRTTPGLLPGLLQAYSRPTGLLPLPCFITSTWPAYNR
jgi:hypothetical protein